MSIFFFDIHDTGVVTDEEGSELADLDAAIHEAIETLPAFAAEDISSSRDDRRHFMIVVRDEKRVPVYTAALSFCGTRL